VYTEYVYSVCVKDSIFSFSLQLLMPELESDQLPLCMLHTLSLHALLATNIFLQWALPYCLASHAFVDCLLAGIMCYYLQKSRAGPGFSS
jgi:hypothetical protein